MLAGIVQRTDFVGGDSVHQRRAVTNEDNVTAGRVVLLQNFKGRAAHRFERRNKDGVICHDADRKFFACDLTDLLGQQGFGDEVEVDQTCDQCVDEGAEVVFHLRANRFGHELRTEVQPIALNRMDDADIDQRLAAGQRRVDACEVIFNVGVFSVPRGLMTDGCGIVALGFPFHGNPVQMRNTDGNAESRLPVALELVTAEVEIPVGNAVQLGQHTLTSVLVNSGLCLLCGGQLDAVAEHINARQTELAVGAHCLTECGGLGKQRRFFHHVTGHVDAVIDTPLTAVVGKGFREAVADMVMIMVARNGDFAVRQIPEQLRDEGQKCIIVLCGKGFGQIGCPRQRDTAQIGCKIQRLLAGELRFICEDSGNGAVKFLTDGIGISIVRDMNELIDGFLGKRIDIGLTIVPWVVARGHQIRIPLGPCGIIVFADHGAGCKITVFVENNVIYRDQRGLACVECCFKINGIGNRRRCHAQMTGTQAVVLCDNTACGTGRPAILVIEPCKHVFFFCFFDTAADAIHEFLRQIRCRHTGAGVHVETAHTHFLHRVNFAVQMILFQRGIPCPERGTAVFGCRIFKKLFGKRFGLILFVKHMLPPVKLLALLYQILGRLSISFFKKICVRQKFCVLVLTKCVRRVTIGATDFRISF